MVKTNQLVVQGRLQQMGLVVDVVEGGLQALEMWRKDRYELALMDCQMPVLDGYQTATLSMQEKPFEQSKLKQKLTH